MGVGEGKGGQTRTTRTNIGDDLEAEGSSGEGRVMCSFGEEKGEEERGAGGGGGGGAEEGRGRVGEKELTWEA
jgi:hypothetical protein